VTTRPRKASPTQAWAQRAGKGRWEKKWPTQGTEANPPGFENPPKPALAARGFQPWDSP